MAECNPHGSPLRRTLCSPSQGRTIVNSVRSQGGCQIKWPTDFPDLIKYDTPHLGPRIQLMLSQLQFKLSVEKQYKEGIEKMASLYRMDGDRKSKADAEAKRVESTQKIQLLKQALKRYEDLHVDFDTGETEDGEILRFTV